MVGLALYGLNLQVCPETLSEGADEVTDAYPDGWYVRIMFDELLDSSIEKLDEVLDEDGNGTGTYVGSIADANPVKLECESVTGGAMVEVDYDGYYSPAGNRLTWPLGPSLVIAPNDPTLVATASKCQITINDVVKDKAGNAVEPAQRGPYAFSIAPIQVLSISPEDGDEVDASVLSGAGVHVTFNTDVAAASFCDEGAGMNECEFTFTPAAGNVARTGSGTDHVFKTTQAGEAEKEYTFAFVQGGKIEDRCGREQTFGAPSADDGTMVTFKTTKFAYKSASIATGETASPMKKLTLTFTNNIDGTTLAANEYTLTPAPGAPATATATANTVAFTGLFDLDTEYTFTIAAGAKVSDVHGVEYTFDEDVSVTWKTQPAITATFSPADNGTITKTSPTQAVGVSIAFNTTMLGTAADLVEGGEFTVTDSNGTNITGFTVAPTGCGATSTSCTVTITKDLAPGTYKFTLKQGATLTDQLGNVYTQAADKVINFTVKAPATPDPATPCL